MRKQTGITIIALVVTIIILLILAGIVLSLAIGKSGIINNAEVAGEETNKHTATEKINLKITNSQMNSYATSQRMPTLQELADDFCADNEIEYVTLESKKLAGLNKIEVGENSSIFTKLKEYPYEFEINSSLQLASVDGIKIAKEENDTISREEYEELKNMIGQYRAGRVVIGSIGKSSSKTVNVTFSKPMKDNNYSVVITQLSNVTYWAQTQFIAVNKGTNGFSITGYNTNGNGSTGTLIVDYVVIPYTE